MPMVTSLFPRGVSGGVAFRTRKTRLLHVPISAPMMGLQDLATASDRARGRMFTRLATSGHARKCIGTAARLDSMVNKRN